MASHKVKPDTFVVAVAGAIDRYNLIAPHETVVVGVSGGLDSVGLLSALQELAGEPERAYRLIVAHLNHRLRTDADSDERFVAELAERRQLAIHIGRRDVAEQAGAEGLSIETAARKARYEFLLAAALDHEARCVATGHHADDNAETVLHRIVRGTHLRGLAGIPIEREIGSGVRLVRPLLSVRREEIRAYAERRGLAWRDDKTNADTSFTRNFIRHEVLRMLRQHVNPRVDEALLRLADSAGQVEEYLAAAGDEAFTRALTAVPSPAELDAASLTLSWETLQAEPPLIQTYAVRQALQHFGASMRRIGADQLGELVAALSDGDARVIELPGRIRARCDGGRLIITRGGEDEPPAVARADVQALQCPGRTVLVDGRVVEVSMGRLDRAAFEAHCRRPVVGVHFLDAERLCGPLVVRQRRDGDIFHPLGSAGRQSVGEFLTNAKVPPARRREVLCVCDDTGIVCVVPLRIDDRVKVTDTTQQAVMLQVLAGEDT